jgi:hypothetical protein
VTPDVLEAAVKMRTKEGPWRSTSTVIDGNRSGGSLRDEIEAGSVRA